MKQVAALFVRADSIYKTMPAVDCYDIDRDARTFNSNLPIVAHPPCRAWGRLRQFAKPREDEKELGLLAVDLVRKNGGVLEHPAQSTLFTARNLPKPAEFYDEFGGYTIEIEQYHFGHRAEKKTWLYIVGCNRLPKIPFRPGRATHCVRPTKSYPRLPSITKPEREKTPPELAKWLVDVAILSANKEVADEA